MGFSRWTWAGGRGMICGHEFFARLVARLSFRFDKMAAPLARRFSFSGFGVAGWGAEYSDHQFFQLD
jgi:hypothetical protein